MTLFQHFPWLPRLNKRSRRCYMDSGYECRSLTLSFFLFSCYMKSFMWNVRALSKPSAPHRQRAVHEQQTPRTAFRWIESCAGVTKQLAFWVLWPTCLRTGEDVNEQPSGLTVHLLRKPALRATHSHTVHRLTRKNSLLLLDFQIGMGCSCVLSPGSLKERTVLHCRYSSFLRIVYHTYVSTKIWTTT